MRRKNLFEPHAASILVAQASTPWLLDTHVGPVFKFVPRFPFTCAGPLRHKFKSGHPPEGRPALEKNSRPASLGAYDFPKTKWHEGISVPTKGDVKRIEALLLEDGAPEYLFSIQRLRRAVRMEAPDKPPLVLPPPGWGPTADVEAPNGRLLPPQAEELGAASPATDEAGPGPGSTEVAAAAAIGSGRRRKRTSARVIAAVSCDRPRQDAAAATEAGEQPGNGEAGQQPLPPAELPVEGGTPSTSPGGHVSPAAPRQARPLPQKIGSAPANPCPCLQLPSGPPGPAAQGAADRGGAAASAPQPAARKAPCSAGGPPAAEPAAAAFVKLSAGRGRTPTRCLDSIRRRLFIRLGQSPRDSHGS